MRQKADVCPWLLLLLHAGHFSHKQLHSELASIIDDGFYMYGL